MKILITIILFSFYSISAIAQSNNKGNNTINLPNSILLSSSQLIHKNFNLAGKFINKDISKVLILNKKINDESKNTGENKSFFESNWFYFVGAAVLATVVYLLWPANEKATATNSTFGLPPVPGR